MAISMDARIDKPLAVPAGDERFFLGAAFAMTLVIVAGFSPQGQLRRKARDDDQRNGERCA